jgi:hypothetical protein
MKKAKVTRSQVVTIRLEPRLHYLSELAARAQRRTLSSYFEWLAQEGLSKGALNDKRSITETANDLWDPDEVARFVRLARKYPELLPYEEQVIWKLVNSSDAFFVYQPEAGSYLDEGIIKENWELLKRVARGEEPESSLP